MKRTQKMLIAVAAVAGAFGLAQKANAAISWGNATTMTTDTDVLNNGSYVDAASFYSSSLTVNGVGFHSMTGTAGTYSDGVDISMYAPGTTFGYSTFTGTPGTSASYVDLASEFGFTIVANGSVTISGLTSGDNYQIQVWSSYAGSPGNDATTLSGSTPVTLLPEDNEFATGLFQATGLTESFNYNARDLIMV